MADSGEVIIVGAGIAGLSCGCYLSKIGIPFRILEASDSVGGRVRTDEVDGFLLDRGFQVFLTAYPEAKKLLDYDKLNLKSFDPGALIRYNGKFHRFSDPWRKPSSLLATAMAPVATLGDKLRVAKFRRHTARGKIEDIYERENRSTIDLLKERGFSEAILERFFRPFLGGVFLDKELETSSRMCEFVFRMFAAGDATLPKHGMQCIASHMKKNLPAESVWLNVQVDSISGSSLTLSDGTSLESRAIVIATEEPTARKLLGESRSVPSRRVANLYYAAPKPPIKEKILILNGDGDGPVNNMCVPSQVSSVYAPADKALISITVLDESQNKEKLSSEVLTQMREWFGSQVDAWQHLKNYEIDYALPSMLPDTEEPVLKPSIHSDGIYACGDYCDTSSINGAMASGRRAAESIATYLE